MSFASLLSDFSVHLQSDQFRLSVRHPDHPTAFRRRRILPLSSLVALMHTGMRKSVYTKLDEFFGHLQRQTQLARQVSPGTLEARYHCHTRDQRLAKVLSDAC